MNNKLLDSSLSGDDSDKIMDIFVLIKVVNSKTTLDSDGYFNIFLHCLCNFSHLSRVIHQ